MTKRETSTERRLAEKESARRADVRALRSGTKAMAQVKRESESFAFDRSRATVNLSSAHKLF